MHFKEFLLLKQPLFLVTEALVVVRDAEILKGVPEILKGLPEILKGLYKQEWRQSEAVPCTVAIGHGYQWPVW